jgi:nucleoid-associated protein YejK
MKHRAKVLDDTGFVLAEQEFEYLGQAVNYCNDNAEAGNTCLVVEVIKSLTGYEEYSTLTTWTFVKEYAQ